MIAIDSKIKSNAKMFYSFPKDNCAKHTYSSVRKTVTLVYFYGHC